MLRYKVSIRSIQKLTGIHWETIRNVHLEIMESTLEQHMAELKASNYRPKFPAVDEFAIRKGHSYATCVMNLETGEVLWVGEGRSKEDFERFFKETEPANLAVCYAMKEEMCSLFDLRDPDQAEINRKKWFAAAKESGIPALVKFAELKGKRIDGLIAIITSAAIYYHDLLV